MGDGRGQRALVGAMLALLWAGCRNGRLFGVSSELLVEPLEVVFPRAYVGQAVRAQVTVRNTGRPLRAVQLSTAEPFAVERQEFELAGGSELLVELVFSSAVEGDSSGTLVVESEGYREEVALRATSEPLPDCTVDNPCVVSAFDVETGGCVHTPVADGTECQQASNVCLLDARCQAGRCTGRSPDCDDQNACTTDACDPASGCVHFPATARCPSSDDPCRVPACEPKVGCTYVDAADGTRCGPADCSKASVCLSGLCREVPVQDGAACGVESPCQPRGVCRNQACERPAPVELVPAWTAWANDNWALYWDSIADPVGNVYWREAIGPRHLLVSVTGAGFPRYRVSIPAVSQMALMEGVLLLRAGAVLEARSAATGAKLWEVEFTPKADVADGGTRVNLWTLSRGTPGTVYVGLDESDDVETKESAVAQVELATGKVRWDVRFVGRRLTRDNLPVDELGYLYGGLYGNDGTRYYMSLSPQGALRWNLPNPHANPAAVFGGRVYHWDHWLSDTATGRWVNLEPPKLYGVGYPRLALGSVSYVGAETIQVTDCTGTNVVNGTRLELRRVDPPSSTLRWGLEIAGADGGGLSLTNTILTSKASILFSQTEHRCPGAGHVLREIDAFGEPVFSCRLPGQVDYFGEGLLAQEKWVAAVTQSDGGSTRRGVRAFALPGFELPRTGWATAWGSPARDSHCR